MTDFRRAKSKNVMVFMLSKKSLILAKFTSTIYIYIYILGLRSSAKYFKCMDREAMREDVMMGVPRGTLGNHSVTHLR